MGPASSSARALGSLLDAGVDVLRLNFSHARAADHGLTIRRIRAAARARGRHVAVLGDLGGPKVRVGTFPGGAIQLEDGERVVVTTRRVEGRAGLVPSAYAGLARDVRPGHRILLDDGNLELAAEGVVGGDVRCRVIHGGILRDRKGLNLPDSHVSIPALTPRDREDATEAARLGVDFLALSFVRRAADVRALRAHLRRVSAALPIVSKIEKPQALDEIDEIVDASDAVMVARGDLGVELPPERVPIVQRELVRLSVRRNRPVIVATQMLESMVERPRPTRAEVTDVATAAALGADAVMLSAETATGKHPVEAVRTMDRILREMEGWLWGRTDALTDRHPVASDAPAERMRDAVGRATALLSRDLRVRCIVVPTRTGTTARSVSADRPSAPVLAISDDAAVCRRLALSWGVIPLRVDARSLEQAVATARRVSRELHVARAGDTLLLVRGLDPDPRRSTPTVTVVTL